MQNQNTAETPTPAVSQSEIAVGNIVAVVGASDEAKSVVVGVEDGAVVVNQEEGVVSNVAIKVQAHSRQGEIKDGFKPHGGKPNEANSRRHSSERYRNEQRQKPKYATRDKGEGTARKNLGGSLAGKVSDRNDHRKHTGPARGAMMGNALTSALAAMGKSKEDFPKAPASNKKSRFAQERDQQRAGNRADKQFRAKNRQHGNRPHAHQATNRGK